MPLINLDSDNTFIVSLTEKTKNHTDVISKPDNLSMN
jgi:hypothetical protein